MTSLPKRGQSRPSRERPLQEGLKQGPFPSLQGPGRTSHLSLTRLVCALGSLARSWEEYAVLPRPGAPPVFLGRPCLARTLTWQPRALAAASFGPSAWWPPPADSNTFLQAEGCPSCPRRSAGKAAPERSLGMNCRAQQMPGHPLWRPVTRQGRSLLLEAEVTFDVTIVCGPPQTTVCEQSGSMSLVLTFHRGGGWGEVGLQRLLRGR